MQARITCKETSQATVKQPLCGAGGTGAEALAEYQTWREAVRKKAALVQRLQLQYEQKTQI